MAQEQAAAQQLGYVVSVGGQGSILGGVAQEQASSWDMLEVRGDSWDMY